MASIWKGTTTATLQKRMEKRSTFDVGVWTTTIQLTFVGKLSELQTAAAGTYAPGLTIGNGYDATIIIKESEVTGAGNVDAATLVVTADNSSAIGGGTGGGSTTVYELEWVHTEFPIENLNGQINNAGSVFNFLGMSDADKLAVKKAYDSGNSGTIAGFSATQNALLGAKNQGYLIFSKYLPVMRKTSSSLFRPTTSGCGQVESPSVGGVPSTYYPTGYNYKKTADRAIKQRNQWVRNQEWTGQEA